MKKNIIKQKTERGRDQKETYIGLPNSCRNKKANSSNNPILSATAEYKQQKLSSSFNLRKLSIICFYTFWLVALEKQLNTTGGKNDR